MSRIAHFDSWSSAETIKQIADSKKGRPSRNIYLFHMTQKFYATDSQTIKKLIFFCNPLRRPSSYLPSALGVHPPVPAPLAAKGQVPLQRLPRDNLETSRSSLSDSKFHYSDFLQTSCLELVADLSRVCRRRLEQVADKLETSRV
jgi:hypothetical protein